MRTTRTCGSCCRCSVEEHRCPKCGARIETGYCTYRRAAVPAEGLDAGACEGWCMEQKEEAND